MGERAVYAYRLLVELPPECLEPGFVPEPLLEQEKWRDWHASPFKWPRRRLYFDWTSAQRRASMLRSWGAIVHMEKSRVESWQPVRLWWEDA